MSALQRLTAIACLALVAAGCHPVEVAKAAEPVLPLHPEVAEGSGDGAVYEYH